MPYLFNPHRHVKIWLSKDKDTFLNLENQMRLAKMREINPRDEIFFIYDSKLLSPSALSELESFCTRYNITPKDVQKDVIPQCQSKEERNLIEIYNDEVSHLSEGGNLASGSDILRWLKPVYVLGTYTDFDVHVDTRKLPETINVEKPLLLSLGSHPLDKDFEGLVLNNDIIAVVDTEAALADIQKIQKTIHLGCSKQPPDGPNYFEQLQPILEGWSYSPIQSLAAALYTSENSGPYPFFIARSKGKSVRQIRKEIIELTTNILSFAQFILSDSDSIRSARKYSDNQIIVQAAKLGRLKLNVAPLILGCYPKEAEALIPIHDNYEFLTKVSAQFRLYYLMKSVMHTSGSAPILCSLFPEGYYKKEIIMRDLSFFAFARYGLDKTFCSKNGYPLHADQITLAGMQNSKIGELSDISWLPEGQVATARREEQILQAREQLPQDFRDIRNKIETHITKIQSDLDGFFGFYRNHQRQVKINALRDIMNCFEAGVVDITRFNNALTTYSTQDIYASIGKSKTQELFDELTRLGQQAKDYLLTDAQGKIDISLSAPPSSCP